MCVDDLKTQTSDNRGFCKIWFDRDL